MTDRIWRVLIAIDALLVLIGLTGEWDRTEVRSTEGAWRTVKYIGAEYSRNVDTGRVIITTLAMIALTLGVLATRHRSWAGFLQSTMLMLVAAIFVYDYRLHEPIVGDWGWSGYEWNGGRLASTQVGGETDPEFGYDEWRRTFYWQPLAMLTLSLVGVVIGWLCAVLGVVERSRRRRTTPKRVNTEPRSP